MVLLQSDLIIMIISLVPPFSGADGAPSEWFDDNDPLSHFQALVVLLQSDLFIMISFLIFRRWWFSFRVI